ncbi:hypothetical protein IVA78_25840 [Bradyrhizobium sp. 137]|uniref:hypothetical protein n=1 Tax=Bradyrhizobium sp. 137 TaxID=2782614 RepID=UPI001FF939E3|nr:hypothetical protein [Bradyrhizobium sp. 137]MCK1758501.1 hypothetical protein [Bradyrhizobium sp. 137]
MKDFEGHLATGTDIVYLDEIATTEPDAMSKTVDQVISELAAEITSDEAALRKKKETVNTLCGAVGRPPAYALESTSSVVPTQIRSDQFYGQPLAGSVRTILEMRRAQNLGAATIKEIFESLTKGGYEFDTKSDDIAQKSLRNSLAKNTALFHKLPNGQFGLLSWYPNVKKPRATIERVINGETVEQEVPEEGLTEDDFVPPDTPTSAPTGGIKTFRRF